MAAGNTLLILSPLANEPPSANYATFDLRNGHPCLDFDKATDEAAVFSALMPRHYGGGGLTVYLHFSATTITSGNVIWDVLLERLTAQDLDADGFAAAQSVTQAVSATDGGLAIGTVAFTSGAQMDSVAAGEAFRLKVSRDADNVLDTADADAELVMIEIRETP
jgi:hypothetical protein